MTRFLYSRHNFSLRISDELDKLIAEVAAALDSTKTDVILYAVCSFVDPTGLQTPDVNTLPDRLADDFKPRTASDVFKMMKI